MDVGASYNKRRLRGEKYFHELLENVEEIPPSVKDLLMLSLAGFEMFQESQKRLIQSLRTDALIRERVYRLMTIAGVGEVTALTWTLEIGDPLRFGSIRQAIRYWGLCGAQRESACKEHRSPISKKRNKHLQTILVEAAKITPLWNPQLATVYQRELKKSNRTGQRSPWPGDWWPI
jgi:transposase